MFCEDVAGRGAFLVPPEVASHDATYLRVEVVVIRERNWKRLDNE